MTSRLQQFAISFVAALFSMSAFAGNSSRPALGDEIAVITNWGGDSVSIVNVKMGKELSRIPVCAKPYDVKTTDDGRWAYVTCSGSNYITRIDLVANLEDKGGRIVVGTSPRDIELTTDNKRAIVANSGSDSISVVDLASGKEVYQVAVGPIPYGIGITNRDQLAIVTLWGMGQVVLVELGNTSGKVLKTLQVGPLPYTVYPTRAGHFALVTCFGNESVYVIDIAGQRNYAVLKVGRSPWGLSVSPDGKTAVIANFYSGDASILEINDRAPDPIAAAVSPIRETARVPIAKADPLAAMAVQARAKNSAFTSDSRLVLMTDLGQNNVMLMDVAKKEIVSTIKVGEAPYGIAFMPKK